MPSRTPPSVRPAAHARGAARPSFPVVSARRGSALLSMVVATAACQAGLPEAGERSRGGIDDGLALLELEPAAPLDEAPSVLRARVRLGGSVEVDMGRVLVVRGKVGPAHLRQVVRDEISGALSKRIVASLAWRERADGALVDPSRASEADLVVAPARALDPGETYAIVSAVPPLALHFQVLDPPADEVLARIWPPQGEASSHDGAVWCGRRPLAALTLPVRLAPEGPWGQMVRGAYGATGARCVRFEAESSFIVDPAAAFVPPPSLETEEGRVFLDPRPITSEAARPALVEPLDCGADELAFGPGCALVQDDRLLARAPAAPLLWALSGEGVDLVVATAPGEPFVVHGLPPSSAVALEVAVVDVAGRASSVTFVATTRPPMAHVLLNEVLANPIGPEPAQEWVELLNDGLAPAWLEGYALLDVGGETLLPPGTLAPGAFALVVNDSFDEASDYDPPPAPGTLLLRVAKLGKNGLANAGEPLKLVDPDGHAVSRFPGSPKPKAGQSVSRAHSKAPDGLDGSFSVTAPTPGTGNAL